MSESSTIKHISASVDYLQEKVKGYELFKTNVEARIAMIQSKCAMTIKSQYIADQKQNYSSFDQELAKSVAFISNLKKIDANNISNLKRMEEHFKAITEQSHEKFSQIQSKILSLLTQKQKIMTNFHYDLENQALLIRALEESRKIDHQKGNTIQIFQDNFKSKIENFQRKIAMTLENVSEKIGTLQTFHQNCAAKLKRSSEREDFAENELKQIQIKLKTIQLKIDVTESGEKQQKLPEKNILQRGSHSEDINRQIKECKRQIEKCENRIQILEAEALESKGKIQSLLNKLIEEEELNEESYNRKNKVDKRSRNESDNRTLNSGLNKQKKSQIINQAQFEEESDNQQSYNHSVNRDASFSFNNEHSIKSNNLRSGNNLKRQNQNQKHVEIIREEDMTGGIKGLLKKSKEKQLRPSSSIHSNSGMKSKDKFSKKSLPPVKEDPFAMKKRSNALKSEKKPLRPKEVEEVDEVVYQVDEEGYLMDEEGNYLQNQYGEIVKLSEEEIQQMLDHQNQQ